MFLAFCLRARIIGRLRRFFCCKQTKPACTLQGPVSIRAARAKRYAFTQAKTHPASSSGCNDYQPKILFTP